MFRVIKSANVQGMPAELNPAVKPLELAWIDERAAEPQPGVLDPVENALREAEAIIHRAEAEANSIREQAYAEGHAEGYAASFGQVEQSSQALMAALESEVAKVREDAAALVDALEPQVLKLCMEMVEKIVRHEAKTDPRVVDRAIRSCLRRVKDTSEVYIRVNPAQVEQVRSQREELLGLADGIRSISVVDDRRVSQGGCIMESASGNYDATIETQLGRLSNKITETYDNGRSQGNTGLDEIQQGDQPNGYGSG